jgi:hypothetical protein
MLVQATAFTFTASTGLVTFSSPIPPSLESIRTVVNVTRGVVLFQPQAGSALTGTWSSPVLDLAANTAGMADADNLLVVFEDGAPQTVADSGLGTDGTSPPSLPGGSTGVRGWLRYMASLWPALVGGRWPVDGSGVTQPVSDGGGSLTVDGTFSTETTLAAVNAKLAALGQALMAASMPVVIASNQTAIPTLEAATLITGQAAQTAVVNNIIPATAGANATDTANFRAASIQVTSTATGGTFIFEQSNDNVNFVALPVFNAAQITAVPTTAAITATASSIIYTFPIRCPFIRLRIASTITGGSIQAFTRLSGDPWTTAAQLVGNNTAANLNTTVTGTVTANIGTGSLAAGTNLAMDVGQQYRANATGAGTITALTCPATPAAQTIKGTAGRLLGLYLVNTNATIRYAKIYNIAAPTLASSTAAMRIPLPQNQPVFINFEGGMAFGTAITCAITATASITDSTGAVALDDVTGFSVHA